jgi:hypothetical protein
MTEDDDSVLHARFAALRAHDAGRSPPFAAVLKSAPRQRPVRPLPIVGAAVAAAAMLGIALRTSVDPPAVDAAQLAVPPWPLATAGLADVVQVPAVAMDRPWPSDAINAWQIPNAKEDR